MWKHFESRIDIFCFVVWYTEFEMFDFQKPYDFFLILREIWDLVTGIC